MTKASHSPSSSSTKGPHPWAFLAAWRDHRGLTQENVSGTFDVSNVTIHRWETGKAPVSVENFFKLAELYGAEHPAQLWFPPPDREKVTALTDAWSIIDRVPAGDLDHWLALGRRLRDNHNHDPAGG
jgi:transcriptional regulator with XRE-family HTH domain